MQHLNITEKIDKQRWPWVKNASNEEIAQLKFSKLPGISIVTPSFNQSKFIEETIRSVILQDYPKVEYLVMDGESNDGTVAIIRKYEKWLTYWQSEKDDGQTDAIKQGFELATGEIIGWLNSDDILLPGSLFKVGRYFAEHPDVDCVVGGSIVIDERGKLVRNKVGLPRIVMGAPETFESLLLRGGCSFYQAASFWRKKAYLSVGKLNDQLNFAMDYDLYLRMAKLKPFGHLPELLSGYRVHPASKSALLVDVRQRELNKLWKSFGRDELMSRKKKIFGQYLILRNLVRNLPLRIAVFAGLVRLPYGKL